MPGSPITFRYQNRLDPREVARYARDKSSTVRLGEDRQLYTRLTANHRFFLDQIEKGAAIYGTTTGFGSSSANRLPAARIAELQHNLMQYHGCGVGGFLSEEQCAAILLVRINCLVQGCSGITFDLVERLVAMARERILPAIPAQGSVGASGDLTPLSYLAAALCGERSVYWHGRIMPASEALAACGMTPYQLQGRDALALMNGTAAMSGIAVLALTDLEDLARAAALGTALLVELTQGRTAPFTTMLHRHKPHPGQLAAARWIAELLHNSDQRHQERAGTKGERFNPDESIQDRYSLRCAPQVIGAVNDLTDYAYGILSTEINSVTDNPLLLDEEGLILNGGHFYGGHIGTTCDALKTATGSLVNLMDRQMALMMSPEVATLLGENLVNHTLLGDEARLHHGFKAMQITLSALAAEVLQTSLSATIFSRPTESGNQDVVSMGTIAARSLAKMLEDGKRAAAILSMALCQGYALAEARGYHIHLVPAAEGWLLRLREGFTPLAGDRPMDAGIDAMRDLIFGDREALSNVCR